MKMDSTSDTIQVSPAQVNAPAETLPSLASFAAPVCEQVGTGIRELFELASNRLRWPKIQLRIGGDVIVIKRAGQRSRYRGQILITDGGKWPHSTWYGRIDESGVLYPGRALRENPAVYELLVEFAADPAAVAIKQGRLYGNCIFCRKRLSDPRSTAHGYGERCAGHYRLPWVAPRNTNGFYGRVWDSLYGVPEA